MYRSNAHDDCDMVGARRLSSKCMTKALHFRKVVENEGLELAKK